MQDVRRTASHRAVPQIHGNAEQTNEAFWRYDRSSQGHYYGGEDLDWHNVQAAKETERSAKGNWWPSAARKRTGNDHATQAVGCPRYFGANLVASKGGEQNMTIRAKLIADTVADIIKKAQIVAAKASERPHKRIGAMIRKIKHLPATTRPKRISPLQGSLDLRVDRQKEIHGIGMGVNAREARSA